MKWRSTVVPMCAYEWVNHCVRVTVCVCVVRGKMEVGAEKRREECSWSSMLLMLIGPYFNHSHWSVSSWRNRSPPTPLSFSLTVLLPSHPLAPFSLWHTPILPSHSPTKLGSYVHSFTPLLSSAALPLLYFFSTTSQIFVWRPPPFFVLDFIHSPLPVFPHSLPLSFLHGSLSLLPLWSPWSRRATRQASISPLHCTQRAEWSATAQRAGAQHTGPLCFNCMAVNSRSAACCCARRLPRIW